MSAAEPETASAAPPPPSVSESMEREPDLAQARRAALMAHQVIVKLKEMGMPDEMDEPLSQFGTDLGDLWSAQSVLAKQLESFMKHAGDWSAVGDGLGDMQATVEHMARHIQNIRAPMERVALWAYEQDSAGEKREG